MSRYFNTDLNTYRPYTRGNYATDLRDLNYGCMFPNAECRGRNQVYRWMHKLFTGEYGQGRRLVALINDMYREINYSVLSTNYFKLIANKLDSLLFSNELSVVTGDIDRDEDVNNLIERTGWAKSVRAAIKMSTIYGDAYLKTNRFGASAFPPMYAYKVVDEADKNKVKCYVLHEFLYDNVGTDISPVYVPNHVRLLISGNGYDYERIYEYNGNNIGGVLGKPVRWKYKDRWIPRRGRYYWTEIDCPTVQGLSIDTEADGVYGTSAFQDVKDLIFAIEQRLSTENWVVDAHSKPILVVGMSSMKTDEMTGEYYLSVVNGKYMVNKGDDMKPEYVTWDGKLEASKGLRDDLMSSFYELSEMGKTFLSGEYSGQLTEQSINNIIKSAIDRGNRVVNDIWYEIRKSLYVLCRLNDIDIEIEDINIEFNIGRTDDDKEVAEICGMLSSQSILSRQTLLQKYMGYNEEQAVAELERIKLEQKAGVEDDASGKVETIIGE